MKRRYYLEIRDKAITHNACVERDEWSAIKLFESFEIEIDGKPRWIQVNRLWHPVVVDGKIQLGLLCKIIDRAQRGQSDDANRNHL